MIKDFYVHRRICRTGSVTLAWSNNGCLLRIWLLTSLSKEESLFTEQCFQIYYDDPDSDDQEVEDMVRTDYIVIAGYGCI